MIRWHGFVGGVRSAARPKAEQIAYRGRPMVFGRYTLLKPDDASLRKWRGEVDEIYRLLDARDVRSLKQLVHKETISAYFKNIEGVLNHGLDETERRLLAIGLFFLKNQPAYRGRVKGYSKMFVGGTFTMESAFHENGDPNCIDSAYLFKELAQTYGITGSIKEIPLRPFPPKHAYYVTSTGKVLDVMVKPALNRLGLFRSEDEYLAKVKMMRLYRLGKIFGSMSARPP